MKKVWITKTGKHLKIKDMTTSHISNCIKLLKRYHEHQLQEASCLPMIFNGEIAQWEAEKEFETLLEEGFSDEAQEFIDSFEAELVRRKECGGR